MKNIRIFLSENFLFLKVKISIYLNRRVFVMSCQVCFLQFSGMFPTVVRYVSYKCQVCGIGSGHCHKSHMFYLYPSVRMLYDHQ